MKKDGIRKGFDFFLVDFDAIDANANLDANKYLMERAWYKKIFGLIKKMFIGLLTGLLNGPNDTSAFY